MKHKHKWSYFGGQAKCSVKGCGKYIQPDGRITSTPTGRTIRKKKTKPKLKRK